MRWRNLEGNLIRGDDAGTAEPPAFDLRDPRSSSRAVSIVAMHHRFALRLSVTTYEDSLRYP
jgi:hypothetical protein